MMVFNAAKGTQVKIKDVKGNVDEEIVMGLIDSADILICRAFMQRLSQDGQLQDQRTVRH